MVLDKIRSQIKPKIMYIGSRHHCYQAAEAGLL